MATCHRCSFLKRGERRASSSTIAGTYSKVGLPRDQDARRSTMSIDHSTGRASQWVAKACDELLDDFVGLGWPYFRGGRPAVEPTMMASLALNETAPFVATRVPIVIRRATKWVASLQCRDGSVGPLEGHGDRPWPTAHAALLWANTKTQDCALSGAMRWLEEARGTVAPRLPNSQLGHDTELIGWPWSEGTCSWVEPTAIAVWRSSERGIATRRGSSKAVGCCETGCSAEADGIMGIRQCLVNK